MEDIRLLGEESLFDEEVVGHIGVVFAIDIDAGVKFLHPFVGQDIGQGSEELLDFGVFF